MDTTTCSCGLLPCICVLGGDDDVLDLDIGSVEPARTSSPAASRLRRLVAANATTQCLSCMFLPCICPGDDEVEMEAIDTGDAASAVSPSATDAFPDDAHEEQDAIGRVRLTPTCDPLSPDSHRDVWIARELKRQLRPHQLHGVRFLYENAAANQGCILADYMGLGKTLQVIAVIYSFMTDELLRRQTIDNAEEADGEAENDESPSPHAPPSTMVLCPAICIPNWQSEFKKWLSAESLARLPVLAFDATAGKGTTASRVRVLQKWKRDGGVLLMGYEMYRSLLNPTMTSTMLTSLDRDANIQVCSRVSSATMEVTHAATTKLQKSAKEFHRLLCAPGADLVVLDEGHRLKDPTSLLCQSVAKIQSNRRLVLTGYPVQNSLAEYWCMVNFARESFLGTYDAFRARYERPIVEGDHARAKELIHKLKGVVLRRGQTLLKKQLPPKSEWILYCKLSPLQHQLYVDFLNSYSEVGAGKATADLLTAYAALLQVMNHPDIIHEKLSLDENDLVNDDEEEASPGAEDESVGWAWESEEKLQERRQNAIDRDRKRRQKALDRQRSYEWARATIMGGPSTSGPRRRKLPRSESPTVNDSQDSPDALSYQSMVLENSGKMAVLMRIIEESFAVGDKVVVFSQSVPTLKVITAFLHASSFNPLGDSAKRKLANQPAKPTRRKLQPSARRDPAGIFRKKSANGGGKSDASNKNNGTTTMGGESDAHKQWFLQIDGSTTGAKRMEYIHAFSSPTSAVQLLLVSTRAGAEGINLHAANRLVLFDVSWNPSNDHQAMCRSHRIGQAKNVHVYRLVSTGTMERMIYEQQMKKVNLSTHVVDDKQQQQQQQTASETPSTSSDATVALSGFLHPPSETTKTLEVDPACIEGDAVLAQCVAKSGHWLVDVVPAHDVEEEEPADEEELETSDDTN